MPRYKCAIEYDGTGLAGWQRQDDAPSVQQYIEEAIYKFCGEKVVVFTAGRTDAIAQVIHFDLESDQAADKVMGAVNFHLKPEKIALLKVEVVTDEFNARFSAQKRHYIYRIINRRAPLALDAGRAWFVPVQLDEKKMQAAAKFLIGQHDFTSFRDTECQAKSPIKTIDEITIRREGDLIEVYVCAKSFLHHMVRNLVGTLKFIGEGKWEPEYIKDIIEAKNRQKAGPTAPPDGLYFLRVDY